MDIFDAARVFGRWWFVAVPLFILTILGSLLGSAGIAPVHTAEASLIFVGPAVAENEQNELEAVNPLLNQSSALVTAAVVSSLSLQGPDVAGILDDEGLSTDFDVGTETRSPIVLIEVRADSSEVATATALRLVELVESDVQLRQEAADVPENLRVTTSLIGLAPVGDPDYGTRTQVRIALLAVGLAVSGGIVFGLEGISRRRGKVPINDATAHTSAISAAGHVSETSRHWLIGDGVADVAGESEDSRGHRAGPDDELPLHDDDLDQGSHARQPEGPA